MIYTGKLFLFIVSAVESISLRTCSDSTHGSILYKEWFTGRMYLLLKVYYDE